MAKHNRKTTPGFHADSLVRPTEEFTFDMADVRDLAHHLWLTRGAPEGSPEVDWERAMMELRARGRMDRL
jgi:hypothetical protein